MYRRMCEEGFASSILDAMEQPIGIALRMLEEKAYEQAKRALEESQKPDDVKSTPMVQMVKSIRSDAQVDRLREIAEYQV